MKMGRVAVSLVVFAAVALCTSACSPASTLPDNQQVVPLSTPVAPTEPSSSATFPSLSALPSALPHEPGDDPAVAKDKLATSLSALLSFTPEPSTTEIRDYLIKEGLKADHLQVSATTTPTGLKADSTTVGWANGENCIMGFIADQKSSVSVLPVLPDGTCFIGTSNGK